MMRVKDVMIPVAGSIEAGTSLRDAAETMRALNIDPIPVVENGRVVGVVSEGDLQEIAKRDLLATGSKHVRDIMSTRVICCAPDEEVEQAIKSLAEQGCSNGSARVPVIDRSQHLVGIVSLEDLRKRTEVESEAISAITGIESISELVTFEEDRLDFMSDESFPASDPMPPPSTLGPTTEDPPEHDDRH
jgi:CBS domain-containing protein